MKNRVFVIGGGSSLKGFDFTKLDREDTICVNKSVFYLNNPTYFITIDATFMNKVDVNEFKSLKCSKFFVLQKYLPYIEDKNGVIKDTRFNFIYDLSLFDIIIKANREENFGKMWNDFASCSNSGASAIQLAILLGYKKIYLLGMDLCVKGENTHFHEGYGQSKEKFYSFMKEKYLDKTYKSIKNWDGDSEIISCSPISILNNIIKYKSINDILNGK